VDCGRALKKIFSKSLVFKLQKRVLFRAQINSFTITGGGCVFDVKVVPIWKLKNTHSAQSKIFALCRIFLSSPFSGLLRAKSEMSRITWQIVLAVPSANHLRNCDFHSSRFSDRASLCPRKNGKLFIKVKR